MEQNLFLNFKIKSRQICQWRSDSLRQASDTSTYMSYRQTFLHLSDPTWLFCLIYLRPSLTGLRTLTPLFSLFINDYRRTFSNTSYIFTLDIQWETFRYNWWRQNPINNKLKYIIINIYMKYWTEILIFYDTYLKHMYLVNIYQLVKLYI